MTSLVLERRDLDFIFYTLGSSCIPSEDREAVLRLYLDQISLPTDRDSYVPPRDAEHADLRRTGERGVVGQPGFLPARFQNSILNSRFARCLVRRSAEDTNYQHLGGSVTSCIDEVNSVLLQEFQAESHRSTVAFPVLPDQICIDQDRQRNINSNDPHSPARPYPTRANPCALILTENPPHDPNNPNEDRGSHSTSIDQITYAELPYALPAELTQNALQVCRQLHDEAEHANNFDPPYISAFREASARATQIREGNAEVYSLHADTLLTPFSEESRQGYFLRAYRDFLSQRIRDGARTLNPDEAASPHNLGDPLPSRTVAVEENEARARIYARPGDPNFGSALRVVWNWQANPTPFLLAPHQRLNLFELGLSTNRYGANFWDRLNVGGSLVYGGNFSTGENYLIMAASLQYSFSNPERRYGVGDAHRSGVSEFFRQFHLRFSALGGVNLNNFDTGNISRRENFIAGFSVDLTTYNNMSCLLPSLLLMLPAPREMDRCLRTPQRALNVPTSSVSLGVSVLFPEMNPSNVAVVGNISFRNFHEVGWVVDGAFLLAGLIYSLTQSR